jgi:hypothetical protein
MFSKIIDQNLISGTPATGRHLHKWIKNFDVDFYRNHEHVFGIKDLQHLSNEEALIHFAERGYIESRIYNKFFYSFIDPKFYRSRYPDLNIKSDCEAVKHWMYFGAYEKRIPNSVTQKLIDANIHLFQMGKVGSKSIEMALKNAGHKELIPHLHWSNEILFTYEGSFYDYDEIINYDKNKEILFISGLRDPIDRVFSGIFQSFGDPKSNEKVLIDLDGRLQDLLPRFTSDVLKILNWFDHEYFSEINVYKYPFNKKLGYSIIKKNNITIVLYRLDSINKCFDVLGKLTKLNILEQHTNRSEDKKKYIDIKKLYQSNELYDPLRKIVDSSRYWNHFFN